MYNWTRVLVTNGGSFCGESQKYGTFAPGLSSTVQISISRLVLSVKHYVKLRIFDSSIFICSLEFSKKEDEITSGTHIFIPLREAVY